MVRRFAKILMLVLLEFSTVALCAQNKKQAILKDTIGQKDAGDLIKALFHTEVKGTANDTVGLKPSASLVPALGYSLQTRLAILLAGNMAFRTAPQSKVSTIASNLAYTQNNQITLAILSSLWSHDNNYNFVGVARLFKYSQSTYGLGSNSNLAISDPMVFDFVHFSEVALRKMSGNFYLGGGYIIDYHADINPQQIQNKAASEYFDYDPKKHTTSSGITLNGLIDTRDSPINAYKGFYAAYEFRQNLKQLGSTSAWNSLILDVRKYIRFPANSNNVLAFWSYNWLTLSGRPPYLDLPSTLWDPNTNAGRGYIQGRFRGAQMIYGEAEYRYQITRNGLIGGVLFVNAETFSAQPGTRLQSIQPAYGPGLRIKLNKVSRTNVAIDYGFGTQGSRGLLINVGELF
ncbi:MAG: BamA/TamA family outer membrane protein [Bacteroidetes bacterium]|nr:BamA/TamA family outer membrane protein [Bacteroidota bacterium]